jgi:putative flippase GtrA
VAIGADGVLATQLPWLDAGGEISMRLTDEHAIGMPSADDTGAVTTTPSDTAAVAMVKTGALGLFARVLTEPETRRVVAFLIAGGISTLVTLAYTSLLTDVWGQRFLWSAIAGTELGVLVQFAINDQLAFRDLAGHRRRLPVRLLRYHLTCAAGQSIILLLSLVLHDVVHWRAVFAQAVPIMFVTAFNFLMHRFWTYRGAHHVARAPSVR